MSDTRTPAAPAISDASATAPPRPLTPEAQRALDEAAARRAAQAKHAAGQPKEIAGRGGLEPTRYGDWEVNGLTSDF